MNLQQLPVEQWLEASLPDVATDPSISSPDPAWLKNMATFQVGGAFDGREFQADLVDSISAITR